DRRNMLRDQLRRDNPVMREQTKLEQKRRQLEGRLRGQRDVFTAKGTAELTRKVGEAEGGLAAASNKALAPYIPEKHWISSFSYQAYRGYYNTAYNHYIGDHVKALVGGGEMREDINFVTGLQQNIDSGEGWSTSVDWDWRTRWERDGSIENLPLTKKWLARVRGEPVTEKPTGVK
ncbi:hypothetical protein ACFL34_04680, partial [Candidatus Sumerlaeota bacterium]